MFLKKLFHDEYIEYLKRENKSNFEQSKNYYIQRELKRFIQIDRKVMDEKENNFLIVHSEEEFKEKCSKYPEEKSVHYLYKFNSEASNGYDKQLSINFEFK